LSLPWTWLPVLSFPFFQLLLLCHPSTLFLVYLFLSFLLSLPLVFILVFYLPPSSPGAHTISTFFFLFHQ
jgi:hypothetical protein